MMDGVTFHCTLHSKAYCTLYRFM